ncbi:hypothetical protein BJX64DRAFT_252502 [Aspergillus heterothallicus]
MRSQEHYGVGVELFCLHYGLSVVFPWALLEGVFYLSGAFGMYGTSMEKTAPFSGFPLLSPHLILRQADSAAPYKTLSNLKEDM